ncbi:hypothetical protein PENSUB_4511 [Penicillium subrubescens]|uniref:Aldose 1-epimerase n=1 Tax=Penicillium subrubescens TaxID=1316194 RepID=A0A1Q5UC42_9EURO|nr:hypothetical protein PENSUB_4511 [Penicillium subrubescens]
MHIKRHMALAMGGLPVLAMASSSTADGDQFKEYTISANNITAKFIPNGARLMSLLVPDRSGNLQDVVFGYDNLKGCRGDKPQAKTSGSDLKNFHDRDISKGDKAIQHGLMDRTIE